MRGFILSVQVKMVGKLKRFGSPGRWGFKMEKKNKKKPCCVEKLDVAVEIADKTFNSFIRDKRS